MLHHGSCGRSNHLTKPPATLTVETETTRVANPPEEPSPACPAGKGRPMPVSTSPEEERRRGRHRCSKEEEGEERKGGVTAPEEEEEEEECGRERLKRHRVAMAGRVWIPETWGQERLLKDWSDCAAVGRALVPNGLLSARDALVEEFRLADPGGFRMENRCLSA